MISIREDLKRLVDDEVNHCLDDVIGFRHQCHQFPERTWQEVDTAKRVAAALAKIDGIEIQEGVGKLGVVGILKGAKPGSTIGLRGDMDALPIHELTDVPYKSKNEGTMHACGHDGHMANLLGAALVLSRLRQHLHGTVKFIFQPAEEGGAGADRMCDDGVLEEPRVDAIFGMHGWPEAPEGSVWVKDGPILASNTQFKIEIQGTGCHAAMPHLGTDQILVAARMIDSLQSISSRTIAPTEPIALTIAKINAGTAVNVIPNQAILEGTLRTVSEETRDKVLHKMEVMIQGISQAHGVKSSIETKPIYPETKNHSKPTQYLEEVSRQLLGQDKFKNIPHPSMGAEDFSYYLQRVPGCFFFLGLDDGRRGGYPSLHDPTFDFNDRVLSTGIKVFSHLALAFHQYNSF
ncbi:M20 metallopeptidase family protein [Pseudobacteriovorax antillogorgiicola]|nr:M20 family metallopeptidase [Pseudobacteriovorax antillogorgiicola]